MKLLITILTCSILFISCIDKQTSEKNARIHHSIEQLFNTQNIEITNGKIAGNKTSGPFISVKVDDCKKIDEDSTINIELALSTIAVTTYEILKDYTSDTSYNIDASIIRTINGKDLEYEKRYSYLTAQKMLINLLTFNHYMELIKNQKFSESYDLFSQEFKSKTSLEKYNQTMNEWFKANGSIKTQEFIGFTFDHVEAYESEYDVMVANAFILTKETAKLQLIFDSSSDEEKILGINL